jgi:hypothetical protein
VSRLVGSEMCIRDRNKSLRDQFFESIALRSIVPINPQD